MLGLSDGWLWGIAGLLLLLAEMIAPGFFLIFIGVAAIVTGFLTLAFGFGLPIQLLVFAVAAVLAVLIGKRRYEEQPNVDLTHRLNDPGKRLEGRRATVIAAVDQDGGRVRLGDSEWSARGGPAAVGQKVVIAGVDGNCLIVRPPVEVLTDEA